MREAIYSFEPTAGLFTAGNLLQAAQTFPAASNLRVLRIPLEFQWRGSTGLNPEGTSNRARSGVACPIRHLGFVRPPELSGGIRKNSFPSRTSQSLQRKIPFLAHPISTN
jgi:hypothetical protein